MNELDIEALLFQGEQNAHRADEARKQTKRARTAIHSSDTPDFMPLPTSSPRADHFRPGSSGDHNNMSEGGRRGHPINRYSAEREENDEIRSRRTKDIEDGKGGSDRASANGSVHSRDDRRRVKSRSPRGHRYESSRDQGHLDRYRPGDRQNNNGYRDRDYDRRPNSRERSHRDDRRGNDRGRDSYGRRDDGDRYRRGSPDRHGFNRKVKTPEPTTDERDSRTVFVQQLAARLRTKDLELFFSQVGKVVDAQIVKDRVSQRSKGVGYVEFKDEESVQKAIGLTGQKLLGIPIIAQLTEAEKNRQSKTEGGATQSNGVPFHRLYVGNIHFSITEDDLKAVFEPFGDLEFAQLQKEEGGRSKGYGFVQFINPDEAKEALEKMNGFELAGRPIRVGLGNDKFTTESTNSLLRGFDSQDRQAAQQGSSFSGMGGRGHYAGGTANFDKAGGRDAEKSAGASALDDTDISGASSSFSRHKLMEQLSRSDQPIQKVAPKVVPKKVVPIDHTQPTRCILLKHMWGSKEQEEDPQNWQKELKADTWHECSNSYGQVVHVGIGLEGDDGEVYVKFTDVSGGIKAYQGLNGRHFGGRQITAQYVVDAIYNVNFREAKNL